MVNQTQQPPDNAPSLVQLGSFGPRAALSSGNFPIAVCVFGLGQVGWHAASLLYTMMAATYNPRDMASFQFLTIARRPNVMPEGRLRADRSILISPDVTGWNEVRNRFAPSGVARWWPTAPRPSVFLPDQTAARCFGRLLLFQDFQDQGNVPKKIQQCLEEMIRHSGRPGSDGRRVVLILSSIAESEGSGMLFDIAAMVRSQLMNYPTTLVAVLNAAASAGDDHSRTLGMANAYATLKELDALMVNPAQFEIGLPLGTRRQAEQTPLLDYVLISGDDVGSPASAQPQNSLPAALTAEMAYTWLRAHASVDAPAAPLPPYRPQSGKRDHYEGYTFFNVSKLGLPVAAANELIGAQLAQKLLAGMISARTQVAVGPWVESVIRICQQDMLTEDILRKPGVRERVSEVQRFATPNLLLSDIERRKDRPDFSLRQLADEFLTFLHNETKSSPAREDDTQQTPVGRLDSLRARIEDTFDRAERQLEDQLVALPTQLACAEGYSLHWVTDAFYELVRALNEWRNEYSERANQAARAYQEARRNVERVAKESEDRASGGLKRLFRNLNPRELADLFQAIGEAAESTIEYVRWSSLFSYWKRLTTYVDELSSQVRVGFRQIDHLIQNNDALMARTRSALERAAQGGIPFPAGVLVDGEWYRQGAAAVNSLLEMPHAQLLERVFKFWAQGKTSLEQLLDRFLRDLPATCARLVAGSAQFAGLQLYITQRSETASVRQMLAAFPKSAEPHWMPNQSNGGWTAYEWLRRGSSKLRSLLLPPTPNWRRLEMPSPDQDEMCLIRMVHGVSAEQVEQLRVQYRRAYERILAEGVPLHIDKRIESTLPDLLRNSRQAELSTLWEHALSAVGRDPEPLKGIIRVLAEALDINPAAVKPVPIRDKDFLLNIFPLNMKVRLPPPNCPVIFSFSRRSVENLAQSLSEALDALGSQEKFAFLINANNRPDIEEVVSRLRVGAYNIVVLDEKDFKSLVGALHARRRLIEIVLRVVDLKLISPFQPAAPVPDRMFFGREKEIQEVHFKIQSHSVTLIGGRRIGKTSTLQRIKRELEKEPSYNPIYLDCHNVMDYADFFTAIRGRWELDLEGNQPTLFEQIVVELRRRNPHAHLLFLFDEVDRLLRYDLAQKRKKEQLFRTFRALSNEKRCQFIFSGERRLLRAMEDSDTALFNFAHGVHLKCLDLPTVERLVTEPFEQMNLALENGPVMVKKIFEYSAGHPRVVQTICQYIITVLTKEEIYAGLLRPEHLDRALAQRELRETIIQTFWGQTRPLARLITLLWDGSEREVPKEEIRRRLLNYGLRVTNQELQAAVKELVLYQVVFDNGPVLQLLPVELPGLIESTLMPDMAIDELVERILMKQQQRRPR